MLKRPEKPEELTDSWFENLKKANIKELGWLELKSGATKRIGESITAFLNQEIGGIIIYGIKNDFSYREINVEKSLEKISEYQSKITDPCSDEVDAKPITLSGNQVIVIFVKKGKHFPYFYNGTIYFRGQNTNYPITDKRMIKHLLSTEVNLSKALDNLIKILAEIKEELEINWKIIRDLDDISNSPYNTVPFKIEEEKLKYYYHRLEDFFIERGLLDSYGEILKKIKQINVLIDMIYPRLENSNSLRNHIRRFHDIFRISIEKVEGFKRAVEGINI